MLCKERLLGGDKCWVVTQMVTWVVITVGWSTRGDRWQPGWYQNWVVIHIVVWVVTTVGW